MRRIHQGIAALVAVFAVTSPVWAHGFGDRYDLAVPLSLWVGGAAIAVVLSFLVMGLFLQRPAIAEGYPRLNLLRWRGARILVDPRLWWAGRTICVALLALTIAAGFFGNQDSTRNVAPTAVWVIWWVGIAYLSALLGNVWMIVNPWSALFLVVERFIDGGIKRRHLGYPRALGVWPAVLLFGVFAWTELAFNGRAVPAQLALLIVGYSLITWAGMAVFGRSVWLSHGDPFATAFGLLARFAPIELRVSNLRWCRRCDGHCAGAGGCVNCLECFVRAPQTERELNLRPPASGLLDAGDVTPSMVVFVLMLLATVTFDGFMATGPWSVIENSLYAIAPGGPEPKLTFAVTTGLVGFIVLFVMIYRIFAYGIAAAAEHGSSSRVASMFVLSLVPIALAYHLAHYFSYLLIQGQLAISLASDPFGFGWNLLGTAHIRPNIGLVDARVAWYTAVGAIVCGHIVAVYIGHVVALREFRDHEAVIKSQFVMLVLMVGYTTASLWILAQPITEFGVTG